MTSTLYVAAGGGGDAIAAAILANRDAPGEQAAIATYAWDRLIIDPLPGPRSAQDFEHLTEHAPNVWEITPHTTPKPPAGSTLPRLARELHARLFLLDPYSGAIGMAQQLRSISEFINASALVLVDVGGDLVAKGDEPALLSPLADALALTACELSGLSYRAVVAGPGVDGELSQHQVIMQCKSRRSGDLPALTASEADSYSKIFDWHPSEATGLWIAAARGHRGHVEIRDAGLPVTLTEETVKVYTLPKESLFNGNIFTASLVHARSLDATEDVIRKFRMATEIDHERTKANNIGHQAMPRRVPTIERIREVSQRAGRRTDYLTVRRLAELTATPRNQFDQLVEILRNVDAQRITPPLWHVR